MASVDQTNGYAEGIELYDTERALTLDLSLAEAQALKSWLLSSTFEGGTAIEDVSMKPVLVKLGSVLDVAEAVTSVRGELDRLGFQSEHLNDEEILDFGRRISASSVQRV